MRPVVAFINDRFCAYFNDVKDAPKNSLTFMNPGELAEAVSAEVLDEVRRRMLGPEAEKSSSALEAAERLWPLLVRGDDLRLREKKVNLNLPDPKSTDHFGNKRTDRSGNSWRYVLELVVPTPEWAQFFLSKKMRPQGKKIAQMLVDDGRGCWTRDQIHEIVKARRDELNSRQLTIDLAQFFIWRLVRIGFLRKLNARQLLYRRYKFPKKYGHIPPEYCSEKYVQHERDKAREYGWKEPWERNRLL